jgi:malonyl-CoA O-methyltransferase
LHEEVARRMQERLDFIKAQPANWLHWQPGLGGLQGHGLIAQRYPKAQAWLFEPEPAQLPRTLAALTPPWWRPSRWQGLAPKAWPGEGCAVDLLWANMGLHTSAEPQALLNQWQQALAVGGFLMFSALGPDTLKGLRRVYRELGWPPPAHDFTDMHDWGDMLMACGFAEPVMDVEHITLTFETPQRLLQELRELGRNLHGARFPGLRSRHWHARLLQALRDHPLQLEFEVVYGHAFKPEPKMPVQAQSHISLAQMRQTLSRSRAAAAPHA